MHGLTRLFANCSHIHQDCPQLHNRGYQSQQPRACSGKQSRKTTRVEFELLWFDWSPTDRQGIVIGWRRTIRPTLQDTPAATPATVAAVRATRRHRAAVSLQRHSFRDAFVATLLMAPAARDRATRASVRGRAAHLPREGRRPTNARPHTQETRNTYVRSI